MSGPTREPELLVPNMEFWQAVLTQEREPLMISEVTVRIPVGRRSVKILLKIHYSATPHTIRLQVQDQHRNARLRKIAIARWMEVDAARMLATFLVYHPDCIRRYPRFEPPYEVTNEDNIFIPPEEEVQPPPPSIPPPPYQDGPELVPPYWGGAALPPALERAVIVIE